MDRLLYPGASPALDTPYRWNANCSFSSVEDDRRAAAWTTICACHRGGRTGMEGGSVRLRLLRHATYPVTRPRLLRQATEHGPGDGVCCGRPRSTGQATAFAASYHGARARRPRLLRRDRSSRRRYRRSVHREIHREPSPSRRRRLSRQTSRSRSTRSRSLRRSGDRFPAPPWRRPPHESSGRLRLASPPARDRYRPRARARWPSRSRRRRQAPLPRRLYSRS
jgi:hypothetical protein